MKKLILEQDECAPDAMEYFEKEFKKIFEMEFNDFKKNCIKTQTGIGMEYKLNNIFVEWTVDSPTYKAYKIN